MKRISIIITSVILCVTMLILAPAQVAASAAESAKKTYISEVKVGMGETSEEAAKELLAEGFTILTDDSGKYADLNKDAGSKSILKEGPNQKIVYLGYKTTENARDAITDLAVMNMNGGYSFQDYEKLMDNQLDTQIKPFVNRFIATLTEYRNNLKKPRDSANYKRANYYRTLLNKLTDDDTGGKPLGDLLVNQTKYEMGEDAYNSLSAEEKKNHCDILTLLMQGNGQAVQLMETELTKSADSADNTWLDRFLATDLETLTENIKKEHPNMTPSEINDELDKRYNDDAKKIRDKWGAFNEILLNYDNAVDTADKVAKTDVDSVKNISVDEKSSKEEIAEAATKLISAQTTMVKGSKASEDVVAHDYLEKTEYGDGTLLEFFERDQSEFFDEDTIRELYPIVEALSGGQIAGLDFLSIKDMILMAVTDENGFNNVNVDNVKPASIFQDVNREIYERGGVALTNDALRKKASAQDAVTTFELSTLGIVLWSCTAAAGLAAAGTGVASTVLAKSTEQVKGLNTIVNDEVSNYNGYNDRGYNWLDDSQSSIETPEDSVETPEDIVEPEISAKSTICKYLSVGFSIAAAILAGISIYMTITEMMEYYKVNFSPIPKYIVDEADITAKNEKGETVMIRNQTAYYKVVSCNRKQGNSNVEKKNFEILKDRNDLNGDVGKQWLSLYSVKYKNGAPILADSLKMQWGSKLPDGYSTGIHRFGEKAAFNLTSPFYCYNDPNKGTYVYYKHDNAFVKDLTAAGSVFSGSSIALGSVIGLIVGCAVTAIIMAVAGKKKKKTALPA